MLFSLKYWNRGQFLVQLVWSMLLLWMLLLLSILVTATPVQANLEYKAVQSPPSSTFSTIYPTFVATPVTAITLELKAPQPSQPKNILFNSKEEIHHAEKKRKDSLNYRLEMSQRQRRGVPKEQDLYSGSI